MKSQSKLIFPTSPPQRTKKLRRTASIPLHHRHLRARSRRNNTGKERDSETGLYYYGARYLDPKASRWLSGDPAVGEYIPSAPASDEARKRNGNLPGMGGVFNYVNLHVYHYAGNNPVKYTDPDGMLTVNPDGTVTFDNVDDKLWKGTAAAGWRNYRDAVNNALFVRDGQRVNIASWYDENGTWIGGDNTLVGITMSRAEPNFIVPAGRETSPLGIRDNPTEPGTEEMHNGIDISMTVGTSVGAAAFGVVSDLGNTGDTGLGLWVQIDHGNGYTTTYAHLSRIWWPRGYVFTAGEAVGLSGNTGRTTGPHLHFELRRNGVAINPR